MRGQPAAVGRLHQRACALGDGGRAARDAVDHRVHALQRLRERGGVRVSSRTRVLARLRARGGAHRDQAGFARQVAQPRADVARAAEHQHFHASTSPAAAGAAAGAAPAGRPAAATAPRGSAWDWPGWRWETPRCRRRTGCDTECTGNRHRPRCVRVRAHARGADVVAAVGAEAHQVFLQRVGVVLQPADAGALQSCGDQVQRARHRLDVAPGCSASPPAVAACRARRPLGQRHAAVGAAAACSPCISRLKRLVRLRRITEGNLRCASVRRLTQCARKAVVSIGSRQHVEQVARVQSRGVAACRRSAACRTRS